MRRMITETDVEKLDSIKPSEIQKLGKITDADIESVKAMQSPKDARANYVLTADGKGKAVYKAMASSGDQYAIKYKISSGEERGTISTNVSASHQQVDGAYISIRDVYPTSSVKRVLGIISPNFFYLKINDVAYSPKEFSYTYGDNSVSVYLPKEFCTRVGITDNMECHYKWEPAFLCVLK